MMCVVGREQSTTDYHWPTQNNSTRGPQNRSGSYEHCKPIHYLLTNHCSWNRAVTDLNDQACLERCPCVQWDVFPDGKLTSTDPPLTCHQTIRILASQLSPSRSYHPPPESPSRHAVPLVVCGKRSCHETRLGMCHRLPTRPFTRNLLLMSTE